MRPNFNGQQLRCSYCSDVNLSQTEEARGAGPNRTEPNRLACIDCGSYQYGIPGTSSCQLKCLAWSQTCSNCGKPIHLLWACRAKKLRRAVTKSLETNEDTMETVIAHITFNQITDKYTSVDVNQIMGIDTYVIPCSPNLDPRQVKNIPSCQK